VQRLRDGDPETEQHFTAYFGELLLLKLRSRLPSAEAVQDVRQEVFLRVLTALRLKHNLRSPESLGAFVNSVCKNLLREWYRFQSRMQPTPSDYFERPDEHTSIESALITEERKQQVRRVLEGLHEKDRELLRLIFYNDLDKAEICQRFGVDREYLRVLVHRAKERFKKGLLEAYSETERDQHGAPPRRR